jgi:hypothetical protein
MRARMHFRLLEKRAAIVINREAILHERLVYIALANKPIRYRARGKKSRIVYIGTTEKGINRIAGSAAHRGRELLTQWGIHQLSFYVVQIPRGRRGVRASWEKLERALIQGFKDRFWEAPLLNKQGKNADWEQYYRYFPRDQVYRLIENYSE